MVNRESTVLYSVLKTNCWYQHWYWELKSFWFRRFLVHIKISNLLLLVYKSNYYFLWQKFLWFLVDAEEISASSSQGTGEPNPYAFLSRPPPVIIPSFTPPPVGVTQNVLKSSTISTEKKVRTYICTPNLTLFICYSFICYSSIFAMWRFLF